MSVSLKKENFSSNWLIEITGDNKQEVEFEYFGWINHVVKARS